MGDMNAQHLATQHLIGSRKSVSRPLDMALLGPVAKDRLRGPRTVSGVPKGHEKNTTGTG